MPRHLHVVPLPVTPLHAICDADACLRAGWTMRECAGAFLEGGALVIQVRAKDRTSRYLFDETLAIVESARPFGAAVIVNDRADIARMTSAAGVHVGQDDLWPGGARLVVGETAIVGVSTHTPAQIEAALRETADRATGVSPARLATYVAVGPVFVTATKATGHDAIGLEGVSEAAAVVRAANRPLVAIGGITLERARSVIDAGASAVAVIADLVATGDPRARVRQYLDALSGR